MATSRKNAAVPPLIQTLLVGDGAVGKTCLLICYTHNEFPTDGYVPTVFDRANYSQNTMHNGRLYNLGLHDTGGGEDYHRLWPLADCFIDVFLLCFDIAHQSSFDNIEPYWLPELYHHKRYTPILIVGCKSDLRNCPKMKDRCISLETITEKMEQWKLTYKNIVGYQETSSLESTGLNECFEAGIDTVLHFRRFMSVKNPDVRGKQKDMGVPYPPIMCPPEPKVVVSRSKFANQWLNALQNPVHSDVTFVVEGTRHVSAHAVILCCAFKYFSKLLAIDIDSMGDNADSPEELETGITNVNRAQLEHSEMTFVTLNEKIKEKALVYILQFLYTGSADSVKELSGDELNDVIEASRMFKLSQLETVCLNEKTIGTCINLKDEIGSELKRSFLNKPLYSDITFNVEGQKVYAHRVILSARCDVMAAMFGGHFREGTSSQTEIDIPDTSHENFIAFLEYLYTDHAPIESGNVVAILCLADQYCLPRLVNLCEIYLYNEIKCGVNPEKIKSSDIDVIGILLTCQTYNAEQLAKWCLHFISTNYDAFSRRQEFSQLTGSNFDHVTEQRWPPLSYLEEVRKSELYKRPFKGKCSVM